MRVSFAKKKKMGKKSKKKRSSERTKTAPLVKFDFPKHGACQILVPISEKLHLKKQMYLSFSSRTEESSWIIKVCVNYFKTVLIDAYGPNLDTTKPDNKTESCSNQTYVLSKGQKYQILETIPSQIIKIYITVIVTIRSICCSRRFSDVVARNFIT